MSQSVSASAANAREDILRLQQWAASIAPRQDPRAQQLANSLFQTRNALETLMASPK